MGIRTKFCSMGNTGSKECTLTVITNPASATCTLTYDGHSYSSKTATVEEGTVIGYSIYHSTYGTTTGSIIMNDDKTLTCIGTYSTSTTETSWSRPNLSSNGTLGGSSFAVTAARKTSDAWKAFDGTDYSNSYYSSSPFTFTIYNPTPIKISKFTVANHGSNYTVGVLKNITVSGSSDNSSYTTLSTYTNSNTTLKGGKWDLPVNSSNYYKYYQIYATCSGSGNNGVGEFYITATYTSTAYNYYWNTSV